MKPALFLALLLAASPAFAGAQLFRGATLHTVTGLTLTNASLLVRDGTIAALGRGLDAPGAEVVDLAGRHVFPGLISPATSLGLLEIEAVRATRDTADVGAYTPDVFAWVAVNPDSDLIPVARANGYTHVETVPLGGVVSGHSAVIALNGWTIEEMTQRRAAGLHVFWPSFALNPAPAGRPGRGRSNDERVRDRDRQLQEIDEFFDQAEAYARRYPDAAVPPRSFPGETTPQPSASPDGPARVPAWEAMLPVVRGEIPLFLHAQEMRAIRSAVEWAARRKYRAVLVGGRDAWRIPEVLATHGVPVAFDSVFALPVRDTDPYDVHFAAPAILARAGVQVAFTAGVRDRFATRTIRNVPYAAAQAMAFGLSRDDALRGLTLVPARILGVDDRLGSLEVGKEATFFAADGDILDIRTRVLRLWIAGREVSLESRHTRLYEKFRARPKPGAAPAASGGRAETP